ncbi:aldo/keto reductase [Nocardiopsis kunsanensis]|uniref:aldo/keto reductase n=1 Tax=Nocardiopsis kunsanensis TaxID=141693 RepID=UPI0004754FD9|nr:aldo/keto reductase [Nocardiopsis kunsanensis]
MNATRLRRLGSSDLHVSSLCLGGNVFGWTADEATSFDLLDAYVEAGGNFVDTADSYSFWVEGNSGGDSETVIGRWLARRGSRPQDLVLATKVSQHPQFQGLGASNIRAAAEASLQRLGVETIDLYYAHFDDRDTPLEESARAFSALVDQGKVRQVGLSNHRPERIAQWLDICADQGLHAPVCVQPHYNLVERGVESDLVPLAQERGVSLLPYFGLAAGFLTGKYRRGGADVDSPRAGKAWEYLEEPRNEQVLAELDRISRERGTTQAAVALAWLAQRPGVASVLSSARNLDQLSGLLPVMEMQLSEEEAAALTKASS